MKTTRHSKGLQAEAQKVGVDHVPVSIALERIWNRLSAIEDQKDSMNKQPTCAYENIPPTEVRINSLLGQGASQPKPEHAGTISRMASELSHVQDATHNLIDELLKQLEPILVGTTQAATTPANPPSPTYSVVGDDLNSKINRQRSINLRLRELIERITL